MAIRAIALMEVPTASAEQVELLERVYQERDFPEPVTVEAYRAEVGFAGSPAVVSEINLAGFIQWLTEFAPDDEREEALRIVAITHHRKRDGAAM